MSFNGVKSRIAIFENNIHCIIEITEEGAVRLLHLSVLPFSEKCISEKQKEWFKLVEVHVSGENQDDFHGSKHTGSRPGSSLIYKSHKDYKNPYGRKLEITTEYDGLTVISHMQFYDTISVVRAWTELKNNGNMDKGLEYVSSFCLTGIAKEGLMPWEIKSRVSIPHNTWCGECQWKSYPLPELGLTSVNNMSMKRVDLTSTGTWPCSEYLPMGYFENTECKTGLLWQIENNGSWHWEISDISDNLYLHLSGPTEQENNWWKNLSPGESFSSAPVAIAFVSSNFEDAIAEITKYRRVIRRPNEDNIKLPVIFNDFMNCLWGEPTTEKLMPLIDAAAEAGCEYFCIDAGWFSDGEWWPMVGEWIPSVQRFKGGIEEPLNYIKSKGMIPGLWLELENMGIDCPVVKRVSDDCFFKRHGKPVIDHGRYQLDFRNPMVIKHSDEVIDRLVKEYGIGYIKMDYNIDAGVGTETDADSFGDGLLQHNRAYIKWIDSIFERYPDLIIENCGSGGMRMEYSLLSRHSIQSCSDQTDYRKMAAIAAASPTAVTPEQCAIWSYPLLEGDTEEVIFNMVNALLMRIHMSGHLEKITPERFSLVKEGIEYYKKIRRDIPSSVAFWPLGIPSLSDQWISLGLNCGKNVYIAVWRLESDRSNCILPVTFLKDKKLSVKCGYPKYMCEEYSWIDSNASLSVVLKNQNTARLFKISLLE
jgi:alpha-galactosidase